MLGLGVFGLATLAHSAVSITTQPLSLSVIKGGQALFLVNAGGAGTLSYLWKKNRAVIHDATQAMLKIDPAAFADSGDYSVDVTDDSGTVTSALAALTVRSAREGEVDLGFDPGATINDAVRSISVQADGKLIIGGDFETVHGAVRSRMARLNADGTVDLTFGNTSATSSSVLATAIQNDGRILVGGSFFFLYNTTRFHVARLNANGSVDTSFGTTSNGPDGDVNAMVIQSDGKIIVAGGFTGVGGVPRGRIARLNADGTLDTTFGNALSGANSTISTIAIQNDGRIVVGGTFTTINGTAANYLARLNTDGSLDTTFSSSIAGSSVHLYSLRLQADGRLVVGGSFSSVSGATRNNIARLNNDGTLDESFGTSVSGTNGYVRTLDIDDSGRVLIAGEFGSVAGTPQIRIARLNSDGTLDGSFTSIASSSASPIYVVRALSDGKTLVGGEPIATSVGITINGVGKLNSDGTRDPVFSNGTTGVSGDITDVIVRSNGKVIIGGDFQGVNGFSRRYVAQFNSDGTWDSSFASSTDILPFGVGALALQADGKLLISGGFTHIGISSPRNQIARLNVDGSVDTTFGTGLSGLSPSAASAFGIQSDGKILIGGSFTTVNGTTRNRIARMNSDGTLDNSFGNGLTGANNSVSDLVLQPDGEVLIGGSFTTVNGVALTRIGRLNSDGSVDGTFGTGLAGANNTVRGIFVLGNGKVLICGDFTTINGVTRNRIARLNPDGSLDETFGSGMAGANGSVTTLSVQSDGRIVVGGGFATFNGISQARTARLNDDGSLDSTYGSAFTGARGIVLSSATQADNSTVVVGTFSNANGVPRSQFARLRGSSNADADLANLTVSASSLSPAFNTGRIGYAATVGSDTVTVTPVSHASSAAIRVRVNSSSFSLVTSGSASNSLPLNLGTNLVDVEVTSPDSTEIKTYSVTTTRLSEPDFWRWTYFGNASNTGIASDAFDYDSDGLINLVEFAFGLNPTLGSSTQIPQGQHVGSDFIIAFPTPPGVSGITYGAEWSTTMAPLDWHAISDIGTPPQHTFSVPISGEEKMFLRLKVTSP